MVTNKSHPADGTLQWCTVCGFTRPRWWSDEADELIDKVPIVCPCNGKMIIVKDNDPRIAKYEPEVNLSGTGTSG